MKIIQGLQLMNKKLQVFFIFSISLFGLCGFKPVDIINATITRKGYSVYYDLDYGMKPRQKLDVYVPEKLSSNPTTLIFFYGGSWQFGDKNMYRFLGQAFASKGYISVIVNYRLYPEVYFPEFVEDGAKAIRWVHNNIPKYGGRANNIFIAGHSAGAHIAALLITDEHYLKHVGGNRSWIRGMIGIAGPYDFLPFTDPNLKALFSKVNFSNTQPIRYVKKGLPPCLLVAGNNDTTVNPENTISFANRLHEFKVPVKKIIYPNIGHIGIILSLASGFHYKAPLLEDIRKFISSVK
ncbi:MAG: alpha/beta hydrolase [Legionella sp.]|nr:alpha/beta hydrolase [Legionella sp.]